MPTIPDGGRDRLEMRRLVERYARAADERDGAGFADVFTDDGVLVTGAGVVRGREALTGIPAKLGRYRVTMHVVADQHLDLDAPGPDGIPDTATGSVGCVAEHVYERDGVERVYVMHIRYDDRYRRVGGRWRIAERRLNLLSDEDRERP